jgi:Ca2+-transporting ATPase
MMTTVSLAVSAVPEGLPAVVTVALAVSVRRLSARRVLVRRLSRVETLGCATVICTDKTGTLTTGVMAVRDIWAQDERGILYAAAACCDAELDGEGGGVGDPTELAILRAAVEHGVQRAAIERAEPRRRVEPFDPDRRRMAVWRASGRVYVKGAAEVLAPMCSELPEGWVQAAEAMASRGLRVLAVAVGTRDDESDLVMLGLIGLADAPRKEAIEAVARSQQAGVRVVMITGDHALTARSIARELGIVVPGVDASELVYARKTAADKTSIVAELRRRGEIVAMTGDGVNDAPSIREADIGVAMGKGATDVTREAADMILTDNDLGGVVTAIREGRIVYDNIRKTVVYLLSGNAAGLLVMLFAAAIGWHLPLLPLHLLWLNVMCEPLPGLALAIDPPDDDVMRRKPRHPEAPLLGRESWLHIAWVAALQAAVSLAAFGWGLAHGDLELARTLAFSTLVFGVLLRSFAARNPDKLLWEVGYARNTLLLVVVTISVGLQLLLLALPWTREVFQLAALTAPQVVAALALGFVPVTIVEVTKLVRRAWTRRPARREEPRAV